MSLEILAYQSSFQTIQQFHCCLYYICIIKLLRACVLIWMESIYYFYCVKIIWYLIKFSMLTLQITKDRKIALFLSSFFPPPNWPLGIQILLECYKYRSEAKLRQTVAGLEEVARCRAVPRSTSQGLVLASPPVCCVTLVGGHFSLSPSFIQEISTSVYSEAMRD